MATSAGFQRIESICEKIQRAESFSSEKPRRFSAPNLFVNRFDWFLVSTSSLGAGVDWASIRMVVHYKSPRNLLDYSQESGRAGRDGLVAHSVVWDPQDPGTYMAPNQNPIGMAEVRDWLRRDQCLRLIPGHFLDGQGKTCYGLSDVQLCSFCNATIATDMVCHFPDIISPAITLNTHNYTGTQQGDQDPAYQSGAG